MSAANRDRARDLIEGFLSGARTVEAFERRLERALDAAEARGAARVAGEAPTADTDGGAQ